MASKECCGQSDDEEGEEEDESEEEEMDEEEEAPEPVKENAMESMYSDVINIARQFTKMVEDTRKKELMSRKTARQSLDFDSPPPKPAKYRHQRFTPPPTRQRTNKDNTVTSQYDDDDDYERDSLCLSQFPKLALLVFVCRKGGELSGLKARRVLLSMNSNSGLMSMDVLKWPKPDSSKICVRRLPMLADSKVYM
jgi:hypothetical protein